MYRVDSTPDLSSMLAVMEWAPAISKSQSELELKMLVEDLNFKEEGILQKHEKNNLDVALSSASSDKSHDLSPITQAAKPSQQESKVHVPIEELSTQEETVVIVEESDSDDVMVIENPKQQYFVPLDPYQNPKEYRELLMNNLEHACIAVALHLALSPITQAAKPSQRRAKAKGTGYAVSMTQSEEQTSGSITTYSDDDIDITAYFDPEDAKRAKRIQSNRESARRSRKRKQEYGNEAMKQLHNLKRAKISLDETYADHKREVDKYTVENRILRAEIDKTIAMGKVVEAEIILKIQLNPKLLDKPDVRKMLSMVSVSNPMTSSTNVVVPMQPNHNQFFHQPVPIISGGSYPNTLAPLVVHPQSNAGWNNMAVTSSMQQAASLEHVHQWSGFGTTPNRHMPN